MEMSTSNKYINKSTNQSPELCEASIHQKTTKQSTKWPCCYVVSSTVEAWEGAFGWGCTVILNKSLKRDLIGRWVLHQCLKKAEELAMWLFVGKRNTGSEGAKAKSTGQECAGQIWKSKRTVDLSRVRQREETESGGALQWPPTLPGTAPQPPTHCDKPNPSPPPHPHTSPRKKVSSEMQSHNSFGPRIVVCKLCVTVSGGIHRIHKRSGCSRGI